MVQSLAISTTILLFVNTLLVTGHSLDAGQNNPQLTTNGIGADQGRRTKLIEYDYEPCPQVPTLHCKHGSMCTPGSALFGKQHDHLDLQTQESGYHCACPAGYIGHECEIEVDYCDENPTDPLESCYHGAKCQSNGSRFFCDCKQVNAESGPSDTKFAGAMCQHESTSMCAVSLVENHASNHQFCTNHGTCLRMVTSGEPHPGCSCTDGWMGDRCELRRDPFAQVSWEESQDDSLGTSALIAVLFTSVFLVAIFVAIFFDVKKKRAADINKGVLFKRPKLNLSDGDPNSQNGASLPAPEEHRSVRDVTSERESDKNDAVSGSEEEDSSPDSLPEVELV